MAKNKFYVVWRGRRCGIFDNWLFYEQPEIDFRDLIQKFMDIRKRAFKFPLLNKKTKFIAIPTTSGTGSEVTPFAVSLIRLTTVSTQSLTTL